MKPIDTMIENAKITGTQLGYGDRAIFTCYITVEGDGWACSYGGFCLDSYDKEKDERVATQIGFQAIFELMKALEVENWEDLKGQYVRVEHSGWGGKVTKIGHLIKDKWFSFEEFFKVCTED